MQRDIILNINSYSCKVIGKLGLGDKEQMLVNNP